MQVVALRDHLLEMPRLIYWEKIRKKNISKCRLLIFLYPACQSVYERHPIQSSGPYFQVKAFFFVCFAM